MSDTSSPEFAPQDSQAIYSRSFRQISTIEIESGKSSLRTGFRGGLGPPIMF